MPVAKEFVNVSLGKKPSPLAYYDMNPEFSVSRTFRKGAGIYEYSVSGKSLTKPIDEITSTLESSKTRIKHILEVGAMRRYIILAAVIALFVFVASGSAWAGEKPMLAKAIIQNADGEKIGYAVLTEGHDGVWIALNVHSLPPGPHAFHIHAVGKCEPPFKTAGGHFNPFGTEHGLKNPEGPHAGDIPNILVAPDGTVAAVRLAPLVTLGEGENSLFHPEGTAIVIHEGPDDYVTDPAGAAGPRIGCGEIRESKTK